MSKQTKKESGAVEGRIQIAMKKGGWVKYDTKTGKVELFRG